MKKQLRKYKDKLAAIGGECVCAPDGYHVMRDGKCMYCGYIPYCPSRSEATCRACSITECHLRVAQAD